MKTHKISLEKFKIDKTTLRDILRMTLVSVVITLTAVLIFGIVIKLAEVPFAIIMPINQVIKLLSVLLGALIGIKCKEKGVFKGAVAGLLYTLISVFVFLILGGDLDGSFGIIDAISGMIIGAVSGIIAVNTGKNKI